MKKLLLLRKISYALILLIVGYHVIFGGVRILIDFGHPMGWNDNTIIAFGTQLRTGVLQDTAFQYIGKWFMADIQPERQNSFRSGFIRSILDDNVYDYEVEMGWFYQYKTMYAYGRNGFWVIQADPFHIKLLRNENISAEDAEKLDETIAGYNCYGDQFTVVYDESDLSKEEKEAYARVKEKAQSRIEMLKKQALFP